MTTGCRNRKGQFSRCNSAGTAGRRAHRGLTLGEVRPGDRVAWLDQFGKQHAGRVSLLGPAGPVVNAGGRYGAPQIITEENFVRATRLGRGWGGRATVSSQQVKITTYKAFSGDLIRSWKAPNMRSAALQAITAYRKAGGNVEVQAYGLGWGRGEWPGTWLKGSQFTLRSVSDGWKFAGRYLDAPSHREAANLLLSDIG